MRTIKSLLVPVDFSDSSRAALDQATALAEKLGATVHLLHAWEMPEALPPGQPESATEAELTTTLEKVAHSGLDAFVSHARSRNVSITSATAERGVPWRAIVQAAEKAPHDLIVMGTHGRKGFARALLGSVTERVVRYAPCPVLSVGPPKSAARPVQRILVPVDYSTGSAHALARAADFASALGAELDVVHVWDRPNFVPTETMVESGQGQRRSLGELIRENAEHEMKEFLEASRAGQPGPLPSHRLLSGEPASTLLAELERGAHDLVIVGTHGRTGLKHLLLGSVAEKLVRYSPVPVLTVR
jgi:nucleotide-binding universal stress UspA family protein